MESNKAVKSRHGHPLGTPISHTVRAFTQTSRVLTDSGIATSHHNGRHKPNPERTRRPPHPHPTRQASLQSCCPRSRRIYVVLRMWFTRIHTWPWNRKLTYPTADVQSLPRRPGTHWPQAPMGPLNANAREGRIANKSLLRQSEKPCIYTAAARRWA